jgi:ribosomal protein S18 acetylase RimI-like enzyme
VAGFVTSLRHERSGWIGNLIVAGKYRGQGIGEKLFAGAFEALRSAGVETFWLTASKSGQALYEKYGFGSIDTIIRWVGIGRKRHSVPDHQVDSQITNASVSGIDCQAWGDRRDVLLAVTVARGRLLLAESGFAVIQPCGDAQQFGPFTALDSGAAERVFDTALRTIPLGSKIYLDAPASNRAALRMFNRRGLRISGTTELMYAGLRPDYRPDLLYGLATMGSCG